MNEFILNVVCVFRFKSDEKEYYRMNANSQVKVPVKWMAVESLTQSIYTSSSDVWSVHSKFSTKYCRHFLDSFHSQDNPSLESQNYQLQLCTDLVP